MWVSEMGNWGLEGREKGVLKANEDWLVVDSNYCGGDIPWWRYTVVEISHAWGRQDPAG